MLKLRKILLVACCIITSDAVAKKPAGFINTKGALDSMFTKATKKAQQAVTGMVVICSTVGLLSCAPIHLYEREGSVQNEQVKVEPVADWEWQEHEWGGRIAVSNHNGEVIGFDDEIRRVARQKLNKLNELAQDYSMKMKEFGRVRSYDPNWHFHFEEVSIVHDQLRTWLDVYGDNPKYYGFDPSFMENLRSALDDSILNEMANTFGIDFGGRLLEGFDNFGWVFSKRRWPSQFGFSEYEDIIWGLSGLDIAKFNSMRSQIQPYDYYGTVILYRTDDGGYHIGQALDQDESYHQLLKATSFFEDQQEKNISVDDIEGINIADDLVQPSHQLVGKFIEFPANTIVQVIHDGGDVITGKIEGYADMVFSNGYILAHTVDTHAEDTHHEAERGNITFLLLKYEPTIKDMFDWDKILE